MDVCAVLSRREGDAVQYRPGLLEELTAEQLTEWRGDPERISSLLPRVSIEAIEKYFVFWSDNNEGEFAYPDDQSPIGDPWQLADFMKRLGFKYPIDETGENLGDTFNMAK